MRGWTNEGRPATWANVRNAIANQTACSVVVSSGLGPILSLTRRRVEEGPVQKLARTATPAFDVAKFMEAHNFIDVPERPFRIMADELSVGLFNRFVKSTQYEIIGHNADSLKGVLAGTDRRSIATYLSWNDGTAYAKWLSAVTGKSIMLPTEKKWLDAVDKVRDQLSGNNWEWTKTPYSSNAFVLHHLNNSLRFNCIPGNRFNFNAVRLVEDK